MEKLRPGPERTRTPSDSIAATPQATVPLADADKGSIEAKDDTNINVIISFFAIFKL